MTTLAEHPSTFTADGHLAVAHLAGDAEAFTALYRRYHPDVLRVLRGSVHDPALAEDLAQEAMLRALRYLHRYDPAKPFWPWLRKIAANLVPAELARRSSEVPVEEIDRDSIVLTDATEQVVSRAAVAECLARLPKRQSRALIMRYVEDRDSHDIAALFGINRNAVEQLLLRARQNLAREYRARNTAPLVPGFAALAGKMRRLVAGLAARLNVATSSTMSVAGDWAVGAVITVGGIGIVTTIGGGPASDTIAKRPAVRPVDPGAERDGVAGLVEVYPRSPADRVATRPVAAVKPAGTAGGTATAWRAPAPVTGGHEAPKPEAAPQVDPAPAPGDDPDVDVREPLPPVPSEKPKQQMYRPVPDPEDVADPDSVEVEMSHDPDSVEDGGQTEVKASAEVAGTEYTWRFEAHLADNNICTAGPCLLP